MRAVYVWTGLALAVAVAAGATGTADAVLANGRFHVVAGEPVDGSLAIRDGRIAYLGSATGAAEWIGPETEVVELGGRAVTPGWIDAHSHLLNLGKALTQVDLVGTASFDAVIARAVAASVRQPAGTWIRGRGWDQNDWDVTAFPTHDALSVALPDHPVWLTRVDGHAALLNAAAMQELGIDAGTPDPEGGRLLRDSEGRPTGVLIDTALRLGAAIPSDGPEELSRALERGQAHCLERGLTTVTDMGVSQAAISAYRNLAESGALSLRAALFLDGADDELLGAWFASGPWAAPGGRLTVRGVKLYADGALGSRGAALIEPYDDDPGNLGLLLQSSRRLARISQRALESGFQVGIHAIGDRGGLLAMDAIEWAGAAETDRFRIEHAQVLRPADIRRMAEAGVIASMQPTHATSDMPWAEDRVGTDRLRGAYAWRKVLDAGGSLAFGSDFPVEAAAPILGFYAAVTRQDLEGHPEGGWLPEERVTRREALRAFTLDAAHSLFLDDEIGSLEVGKRADLVVFERDPMTVPDSELPALAVDMTWVDGALAYRREAVQ